MLRVAAGSEVTALRYGVYTLLMGPLAACVFLIVFIGLK